MAVMDTLKNKKREFFYSWRGNLASEPSEDEGTVCRKKPLGIGEETMHRRKEPGLLR